MITIIIKNNGLWGLLLILKQQGVQKSNTNKLLINKFKLLS